MFLNSPSGEAVFVYLDRYAFYLYATACQVKYLEQFMKMVD